MTERPILMTKDQMRAGFASAYGEGDVTTMEMHVGAAETKTLADVVAFACDWGG